MGRLCLYFAASLGVTLLVAAIVNRSRMPRIETIASNLQDKFPRLDNLPVPESGIGEATA
jgi:hypothetical protein